MVVFLQRLKTCQIVAILTKRQERDDMRAVALRVAKVKNKNKEKAKGKTTRNSIWKKKSQNYNQQTWSDKRQS